MPCWGMKVLTVNPPTEIAELSTGSFVIVRSDVPEGIVLGHAVVLPRSIPSRVGVDGVGEERILGKREWFGKMIYGDPCRR